MQLPRAIHIEQPHGLAIPLELILDLALQCERLRLGQIDARVIQVLAVVDADGNHPPGLGMRLISRPLVNPDRAHVGRVRVRLGNLAWILPGRGERENERSGSEQHGCLYPQAVLALQ